MADICANTKSFTYHIISRGREKEKEKEGKRENKEKTYASNRASTNCRSLQAQQHQSPRDYNAAHKHVNEVITVYAQGEYEDDLQFIDHLVDQTACMPRVKFTTRCTSTVTKLS